jgi:hypothetical protein
MIVFHDVMACCNACNFYDGMHEHVVPYYLGCCDDNDVVFS